MKPKLFIFALLALFVTGCAREPFSERTEKDEKMVTISVTIPQETRVSFDDGTRKFSWETGDQLLLAGYGANGNYINCATFTWQEGNTFKGIEVDGAITYKAYYPGNVITLDGHGKVQLPANFWQQTQDGNNTTAHLRDKLFLSDTVANAINQTFDLTLESSIVRFDLNNIPSEVGTLQKVIWTLQTSAEGFSELTILNVIGVDSGTTSLTAFLAFDPAVMRIVENGEVKVTLIGSQSSYEWRTNTTKTGGMTYEAGKRYYATVNGAWTALANPQFRFTIMITETNPLYEIWQKEFYSTSPAKITINWGDEKPNTIIPKDSTLTQTIASHTYDNEGDYTIIITSDEVDPSVTQMPQIVFAKWESEIYVGDLSLTAILDPYPNMGAMDFSYNFVECDRLSTIPADLFKNNTDAVSFSYCFENCMSLNTIPAGLFKYNTNAIDFLSCFENCNNLTSIPDELFKYNTLAENFNSCFEGSGLTGFIPAELFKYNTGANNFAQCFAYCLNLTDIPAELFKYNTQVIFFNGCFYGCSGLTCNIPAELFKYNTQAEMFQACFSNCNGLTGIIPAELFKYNGEATSFSYCFFGCTGLKGIPPGLFDTNTEVTNFESCFEGCTGIIGTIPSGLFDKNTAVTNFGSCFKGCTGITDTIPLGLFDKNTAVTYFGSCFSGCTGLEGIPSGLFDKNTEVTNFESCFEGCTGITDTIPSGLFDKNTKVTEFGSCFSGCTGLQEIPSELFNTNTLARSFQFCFAYCTGLTTLPADLFRHNTQATNFQYCFYNCSKLKLRADIFPDPTTNADYFAGRNMYFRQFFYNVGTNATTAGTAPELWRFNGGGAGTSWTITDCFTDAKITNYNSVPAAWGIPTAP
jgi:hypothetical protein